ncbi:lysine transporter LysE [Malaciobacter halophilus]|uniref:Lysine transporter LysE n=1 Tax=Malaciobacter halophilus TaxID=197482 RepID=A0A2N1J385_9BACT|nr:LysE family transporter [Malaciobacter halophilus]AXH08560.1 transporter, LysE family [Malaciobacter halophilus]PKI81015.1 lysine transporter LysE [Malaciobacter halophilus]
MSLDIWLTLFIASIFLSISPGAGAVVSMNYGLKYGLKKSYGAILGLQTGLFLQTFIVVIGLGTIISKSVMLFNIIKWLGVLYLLYLAFSKIFEKVELIEEEKTINKYSFKKAYISATLINLTNIKSTVFLVAFIPQFINTQSSMLVQFMIICLTLCIVDTVVMTGYSTLASKLKFLVKDVKAMKIQNRITGFFLALAAFFVSTAKRA